MPLDNNVAFEINPSIIWQRQIPLTEDKDDSTLAQTSRKRRYLLAIHFRGSFFTMTDGRQTSWLLRNKALKLNQGKHRTNPTGDQYGTCKKP